MPRVTVKCITFRIDIYYLSNQAPAIVEGNRPGWSWPEEGRVEFKNYSTRYRPGLDLVLKGVTCNINPGEKVRVEIAILHKK